MKDIATRFIALSLAGITAGCAIVSTERVGASADSGGLGSAGIPYMLPKALLPLELVANGGAIRIDVLEPVIVGDPDHLYVLRYGANPLSNDEVKIEVDPSTSLLKTVTLKSKDETGEVLKKAIALGVRAESAVGSTETVLLQTLIDPSKAADITAVTGEVDAAVTAYVTAKRQACAASTKPAFCADIEVLPNGGTPATTIAVAPLTSAEAGTKIKQARADCSTGICSRATLPYAVTLGLFGLTRRTHVLLPNDGPAIALALNRNAFVTTTHTVVLRNGMLDSYETTKPSSALAIVSWPLDVYEAVVSTTAKILQLKIDTSRNALSLEEQLLAEAKKRKEIEEAYKELQAPKAESAILVGMGGSRALLTVGTGRPPPLTPTVKPGFNDPQAQPSTDAGADPNAPKKTLPGSSGTGGQR